MVPLLINSIAGQINNFGDLGSDEIILSNIDSGEDNINSIRQITAYEGNFTIGVYESNSVINPEYYNPWNTTGPISVFNRHNIFFIILLI